jgi:CheY-like chemotaxis protein
MAKIAYLCTDLLFTSKIRETAQGLGHTVAPSRDPDALAAAAQGAAMVIVDLRLPSAIEALTRLRADALTRTVPAVGFCDHEKVELMERARAAGCSQVYAKGKFSSDLRQILAGATPPAARA